MGEGYSQPHDRSPSPQPVSTENSPRKIDSPHRPFADNRRQEEPSIPNQCLYFRLQPQIIRPSAESRPKQNRHSGRQFSTLHSLLSSQRWAWRQPHPSIANLNSQPRLTPKRSGAIHRRSPSLKPTSGRPTTDHRPPTERPASPQLRTNRSIDPPQGWASRASASAARLR